MMERSCRKNLVCCLILAAATFAVYWNILGNDFVDFDDLLYVVNNSHVTTGLSVANVAWAFSSGYAANWHPLTWLSHMVDVELFSLDPRGHHMVSLVLHCVNAALLFLVLNKGTGARWRSFIVAALFALHPLHVESVAWVAERKDVLSTFFGLLALLSYVCYARTGKKVHYLAVAAFFALGLMAKPMLVTLPFVMLLLDYWPLERFGGLGGPGDTPFSRLLVEKIPLFALSVVSCGVTYAVQAHGEAVQSLAAAPLSLRVANAFTAYLRYLGKALWPADLAVLYPLPKSIPVAQTAFAVAVLAAATFAVLALSRKRPYLPVGWLWFLGTLVPVIGLVQVGVQGMADRYTYFPMTGIFIMAVWGVAGLAADRPALKTPLAAAAALALVGYSCVTWQYERCWSDTRTLFTHAIAATGNNYYAHYVLGNALSREHSFEEALAEYEKARQLEPRYSDIYVNTGIVHAMQGNEGEAVRDFTTALSIKPDSSDVHYNLAVALQKQGRLEEAVQHYNEELRINPESVKSHYNAGVALARLKRCDEAKAHFTAALRLRPDMDEARRDMQMCM